MRLKSRRNDAGSLVVEPFAGDAGGDNLGPVGRLYYSASTAICVLHTRPEGVGLALCTQAGPAQLAAVFQDAGFSSIRRADETLFSIVLEVRR